MLETSLEIVLHSMMDLPRARTSFSLSDARSLISSTLAVWRCTKESPPRIRAHPSGFNWTEAEISTGSSLPYASGPNSSRCGSHRAQTRGRAVVDEPRRSTCRRESARAPMSRLAYPGGPRACACEEPLSWVLRDDHCAFSQNRDDDDHARGLPQEPAELLLDFLPCSGVPDDADDQRPRVGLERAQADLDGELTAVLAAPKRGSSAFPHGTGVGLAKVDVARTGMVVAEPLRNESLDLYAEQFLT